VAKKELSPNKSILVIAAVFLAAVYIPFDSPAVKGALVEAFLMLGDYAREHVLLCLVPAMFIAGAVTVFLNKQSVIRYLGPKAPRVVAYGVASLSGAVLAVCSCTVLPLFKGIYKKGAGLGPAVGFLYSGPAINILAIVLSYKVFGWELGLARMIGAVFFSVLIGLIMQFLFRKDDEGRLTNQAMFEYDDSSEERTPRQILFYMISMIGILVFINWADSRGGSVVWDTIFRFKYVIVTFFVLMLIYALIRWFTRDDLGLWVRETRDFSLQIFPYLFAGVLAAGFLLGRPGHEALIPVSWVSSLVGENTLSANFFAALSGSLMYFATLTEIPILQGLMGAGMGKGPALALLLAGPTLSIPSILVIGRELGVKKTSVYVVLVVLLSTGAGWLFGLLV